MKLQALLATGCLLFSTGLVGCDGLERVDGKPSWIASRADASRDSTDGSERVAHRSPADGKQRGEPQTTRFETRIGPQPWPSDLPEGWPTPDSALVLADTNGREEGRLLLVDLPASPRRATVFYHGALRDRGFRVDRMRIGQRENALHVTRDDMIATLSFFARDGATRVEILFVEAERIPRS